MLTVLDPDQWRVGLPDYFLIGLGNNAYDVQNASSGYSSHLNATYSLTSINDTSIRFELHSGDHWWWDGTGSERTEISSHDIVSYGTPLDVSYKFTLDPGAANTAKWLVIGQLHQDYAPNQSPWSPPFSINLVGEKMAINIGFTDAAGNLVQKTLYVDAQNIVRGHEYDIDVKAVFDPSGNGRLIVTRDGVTIADYSGSLGYSGHTGVYWKEGLYRSASPETIAATYADLQISHGDMVQIPAAGAAATTPAAAPSLLVRTVSQNSDGTAKATISGTAAAGLTVNVYDGEHLIATTLANASGNYSLTLTGLAAGSHEISATFVQGGVFSRPSAGAVVEVGTASDILSRIDLVTAKDGLAAVILTDTHVFTITSTSQMNTLLTADKAALDKIVGGYSFQFFSGTSDNRTISYYDATGTLVEAETKTYQSGVLVRDTLLHYGTATVVKEVYQYSITGKSYTSTYQTFDAAGNMLEIKRFHANGTLDYHSIVDAQGTTTSTSYNATGVKTTDVITLKTGTVTSIAYDSAGVATAVSTTWTDKSSDYKIYTNGLLTSETIARTPAANGSQLTEVYDANGKLTAQKLLLANGSSDTKNYTNGVLMQETIVYGSSSGSAVAKEIYKYHVTGKAYGTTHTTYDAAGKQLVVEYLVPSEIATSMGASLSAPTAITPTITAFSPDSSTAGDGLTNANHITLSGTAEAGSTVKIFDYSIQIGSATANASGVWSYNSLALSDATHSFTAQAVDSVGDISATSSSFKVSVDTVAPALTLASSDGSVVNNAVTGLNHFILTGTGEAGRQVQVFDGAKQIGSALVDSTGAWSFATATLTDGAHAFTVKETDAAGNVGTSVALNVIVDTAAPNVPVVNTAAVETNGSMDVSGTAEAGAVIRLYDGTKLLGTGTVAANGAWTINIGTPAAGAHAFSATATDAAGNLSHSSSALNSVIGTIIEATGTTTLVLAGGNYHLQDSGTDLLLQYSGAAVQVGQFGTATPIAAEKTATGYDVAWKVSGADQYFVWSTDSNGNFVSNLTGTVSGSSSALKSLEAVFHQDLNGDGTIGLPAAAPTTVIESSGTTSLTQIGNNYFLNQSGVGPELQRNGAAVVASQFAPFALLGAEKTSTGYDVAWKVAGADQYIVWNVDNSGNFVSNLTSVVSGSSSELKVLETVFHQDLNGDGTIGLPAAAATTVIESAGSTSLTQVGNNFFFYQSGVGPELQRNGAAVVAGQFAPFALLGAEKTSTGYDVAWKVAGADQYIVWNVDNSGNFVSNLTAVVSGSSSELKALETVFHQDLNGDGTIGMPAAAATTVIESAGSTSLTQVGNDYFLYQSGVGPELQRNGTAVVAGQFAPFALLGAEKTSTGYDVAWKVAGADQYIVWNVDNSGNFVSNLTSVVSGSSNELKAFEPVFQQDLNGDGLIGTASTVINVASNVTLLLSNMSQAINIQPGASVELTGAVSGSITFKGVTGSLVLDHSTQFTGKIYGLSGNGDPNASDLLDLRDVSFGAGTSAVFSGNSAGGTLTVDDGLGHAAHITLVGNYTASTFNLASDGSGGTMVIDPPVDAFHFVQPAVSQSPQPSSVATVQATGNFAFAAWEAASPVSSSSGGPNAADFSNQGFHQIGDIINGLHEMDIHAQPHDSITIEVAHTLEGLLLHA